MQYVLIIGGGRIGYYLARTLKKNNYRVGMIEKDRERSALIASEIGITVLRGDGTDIVNLREAKTGEASFVIAVTGREEDNLIACQIAKRNFRVKTTIARAIDPDNGPVFRKLGVDETICTTDMAIQMVENVMPARGMRLLSVIGKSAVEINEFTLDEKSPAGNSAVASLHLPSNCVLIAVQRKDQVLFPRGDTILLKGDQVFALARGETVSILKRVLLGE